MQTTLPGVARERAVHDTFDMNFESGKRPLGTPIMHGGYFA